MAIWRGSKERMGGNWAARADGKSDQSIERRFKLKCQNDCNQLMSTEWPNGNEERIEVELQLQLQSWRKSSRIKEPGTWTCQECTSELERAIQLYEVNCKWIISKEDNAKIIELREQLRQEKGAAIWAVKKNNKWQREWNLKTKFIVDSEQLVDWKYDMEKLDCATNWCKWLSKVANCHNIAKRGIVFSFVWNALILNFPGVCQLTRSIDRERERGRSQTKNISDYVSQSTDQLIDQRVTVRRIHHCWVVGHLSHVHLRSDRYWRSMSLWINQNLEHVEQREWINPTESK